MSIDFYSEIYDPLFKKGYTKKSNRAVPAIELLNKHLKRTNDSIDSVIDIGCAWGKTLKYFRKKGKKVVGVDVSKTAIKHCKKRGYECFLASADDLSLFNDKTFDLYISTDVYEHLLEGDLDRSIEEAKRIAKKYILIRPHPGPDKRKTLHLTVWTLERWKMFFESHDLSIIEYKNKFCYKNSFLVSYPRMKIRGLVM